jgi:hypothetical protein
LDPKFQNGTADTVVVSVYKLIVRQRQPICLVSIVAVAAEELPRRPEKQPFAPIYITPQRSANREIVKRKGGESNSAFSL